MLRRMAFCTQDRLGLIVLGGTMNIAPFLACTVLFLQATHGYGAEVPPTGKGAAPEEEALRDALLATTTRHLDALLDSAGKMQPLKGKSAAAAAAMAFRMMFEVTGEARFRGAALELAERELQEMRATKFGVRAIKEKEKGNEKIMGGGPPPFGFYTAYVSYILKAEGGRKEDLK